MRIAILEDSDIESLENFTFYLYSASGATIAKQTTTFGIVDNDSTAHSVFSYGRSDDIYTIGSAADIFVENFGGSTDLVRSPVSYTLGPNVENLTLIGSAAINGTGNSLNNVIRGNVAANGLNGGTGHDTLNGAAGADTMVGGTGNDVLVVDNPGDIVSELAGGGTDRVESSRSYTLGSYVENLALTVTGAINGTGNALNNIILGNGVANVLKGLAGSDTLDGKAGADRMEGGTGNDTYVVDTAGDVIVELVGGGTDTVFVNRTFSLAPTTYLENLTLTGTGAINGTGNSLANILIGNAASNRPDGAGGNDIIDGGAGADTMIGGTGNDTFVVDNAGDVVTEAAGAGTDTVQSSRSYVLGFNLENLTLTGSSAISGTGNTLNNVLICNSAINTLAGGNGNDTLDGGGGTDRISGGLGNDVYVVDNLGEVVTEATNSGLDLVQAKISYTLGNTIGQLSLIGNSAIHGTGNSTNNVLVGNDGAVSVLNGGAGADSMRGGAGNDTYVIDNVGDTVTETANAGTDTVQSRLGFTLGNNVEYLTLTGTSAINGTGNTLNNVITGYGAANSLRGGVGNDTLNGSVGNDVLIGGAGNDRLAGGTGNDTFHFDNKVGKDTIIDFNSVADTFRFSQAGIRIVDGDTVRDSYIVHNFYGGFSAAAEIVVFTPDVFGAITTSSAASVISSATTNFAAGATRLFVVDNGSESGIFLFASSALNAQVSAAELTQTATFNGTATTASDYVFSA